MAYPPTNESVTFKYVEASGGAFTTATVLNHWCAEGIVNYRPARRNDFWNKRFGESGEHP